MHYYAYDLLGFILAKVCIFIYTAFRSPIPLEASSWLENINITA